jgi:hypothetical protein
MEQAVAVTQWLPVGWYWLACISDGTPTVRSVINGGVGLLGVSTTTDADVHKVVYAAQAYGALPANFPAPTYGATSDAPRVMIAAMSGMEDVSDGWRTTEQIEQGTLLHPPHVSGRYYGSPLAAAVYASRTATIVANYMYASPFLAGAVAGRDYDRISIHVTTAALGKSCQLGIYADSAGVPGALVLDAGNVSAATTGGKEINIAQTLARGWYWLACLSDGTPTLRRYYAAGGAHLPWLGHNSGQDLNHYAGMYVAQAYGALPDPFTAGAVLTEVPRVLLRAT